MNNVRKSIISFAIAVIFLAIAIIVPTAIALAQDEELTLAGLAEQVTALVGRVEAIENILSGPGATALDGGCEIAADGGMQNETVVKWQEERGEWPNVDQMRVTSVVLNEDETTLITYALSFTQEHIEEIWSGCEFVTTGDWYELDWQGNRIDE